MKIVITEQIPDNGIALLKGAGHDVVMSGKGGPLSSEELITLLREENPDAVLCLLTNTINTAVFDAAPRAKIFANYAVGYDNIDVIAAKERGIVITNTPGVLTEAVAEFTVALIFALTKRVVEADQFTRAGKYHAWGPMLMLGTELKGKTLGILGAGRIGVRTAEIMKGSGMHVIYHDIRQSPEMERVAGTVYRGSVEDVLQEADVVSVHVPLLDTTRHLINEARLQLMKKTAYLINTSRGPVVDERALVAALAAGTISGAALDVFEFEPRLSEGLAQLSNVIITPHIASATTEARAAMAAIAAQNILAVLEGGTPQNPVTS